ncbi:MAG: hypothetical protein K1000chlam4_00500 [Chlamydiae bacterium]|nr:hypothetical protein [Chlamydiota bacterium]
MSSSSIGNTIYHSVPGDPSEACWLCREELTTDVVAHEGEGRFWHPLHRSCLNEVLAAARLFPKCGVCNRGVLKPSRMTTVRTLASKLFTPRYTLPLLSVLYLAGCCITMVVIPHYLRPDPVYIVTSGTGPIFGCLMGEGSEYSCTQISS